MKFRLFALIAVLALSLVGWAQDTPAASAAPNSTPAPQAVPQEKGCCHQDMAGRKDGKGCCHHAAADAKDATGWCGKNAKCEAKDGKSCCSGKDMKAAMKECKKSGGCTDGKCCGEAKGDKAAMECCGNKCEGHAHTPAAS